jgi:hypothetical protein
VNQASQQYSLLFPHGELVWHLAVRYQGEATRRNNRILCRNFAAYRLCTKCNWYSLLPSSTRLIFFEVYSRITEMRVPSLPMSPGASQLVIHFVNPTNIVVITTRENVC